MPIFGVATFDHRSFLGLLKTKVAIRAGVALFSVVSLFAITATEAAGSCEIDKPVRFVAINSESSHVLLELERFIVEHGYGCQTKAQEVVAIEGVEALVQQQADVYSEVWLNSVSRQWQEAEESGKVIRLGELYLGGGEAFVPNAVIGATKQAQEQDQPINECAAGVNCSEDPLAYPDYAVFTALQSQFSEQAPQISAFLANVRIQPELMSRLLKSMQEQKTDAADAARQFLNDHEEVWMQWLPREVALHVKAAL